MITPLDVLKGASLAGLPMGAQWRLQAQAEILAHRMRYGENSAVNCGSAHKERVVSAIEALADTPIQYLEAVAKEEVRNKDHTSYWGAIMSVVAAMRLLGTAEVTHRVVHYDQCAYCVLVIPS